MAAAKGWSLWEVGSRRPTGVNSQFARGNKFYRPTGQHRTCSWQRSVIHLKFVQREELMLSILTMKMKEGDTLGDDGYIYLP